MTNEDDAGQDSWLRERVRWLGWSDALYWLPIFAPFLYVLGVHDHDRGLVALGFLPYAMGVAYAAALLIWQAPTRTPPRSRRDRAATISLSLAPLLGFAVWPADPLSFDALRTLEPICIVTATAAMIAAAILRPFPPRLGRALAVIGAAVDFALVVAYVLVLFVRSHAEDAADLDVVAALMLGPFALGVGLLGALLASSALRSAPERA